MTDITECDVDGLLEKMKEEIKAYNLSNSYHISLAMGLANYNEGTDKSVMELIKRADGLMYSNKKAIKRKPFRHNMFIYGSRYRTLLLYKLLKKS